MPVGAEAAGRERGPPELDQNNHSNNSSLWSSDLPMIPIEEMDNSMVALFGAEIL